MSEFPPETRPLHEWAKFDPINDTVTIYDIVYSRELLRCFAVSPVGFTFKIVERHPGWLAITQTRSALEAAAPAMLAALKEVYEATDSTWPLSSPILDKVEAAIAEATRS